MKSVVVVACLLLLMPTRSLSASEGSPLWDDFAIRTDMSEEGGGSVVRMEIDVTNDGEPELWLTSTQAQGNSNVADWVIYQRVSGQLYRVLGTVALDCEMFRVSDGVVTTFLRMGPTGDVVTYHVAETGIVAKTTAEGVQADTLREGFVEWRAASHLRILIATFESFMRQFGPDWRDYFSGDAVMGIRDLAPLTVQR